jgi:hypothetical protein
MRARIIAAGSDAMLFKSPLNVGRDACVETFVLTTKDINVVHLKNPDQVDDRRESDDRPNKIEPKRLIIFPIIRFDRDPNGPGQVKRLIPKTCRRQNQKTYQNIRHNSRNDAIPPKPSGYLSHITIILSKLWRGGSRGGSDLLASNK